MEYSCWGGEHTPVLIVSLVLWTLYAVAFPATLAYCIVRNKISTNQPRDSDAPNERAGDLPDVREHSRTGYWHSTRPLIELFWFPLVSHLQPKYWWFFLVEFFRASTLMRVLAKPRATDLPACARQILDQFPLPARLPQR